MPKRLSAPPSSVLVPSAAHEMPSGVPRVIACALTVPASEVDDRVVTERRDDGKSGIFLE